MLLGAQRDRHFDLLSAELLGCRLPKRQPASLRLLGLNARAVEW